MKKLENKCMLITYSDSMGKNLNELGELLEAYFKKAVGGVHILPVFSFFRRPRFCPDGLSQGRAGVR